MQFTFNPKISLQFTALISRNTTHLPEVVNKSTTEQMKRYNSPFCSFLLPDKYN